MDFAANTFSMLGIWIAGIILWMFAVLWVWEDADDNFAYGGLWVLMMVLVPVVTFPLYLVARAVVCRQAPSRTIITALNEQRNPQAWGWSLKDNPERDLAGRYGRYDGNHNYTLNTSRPGEGYQPYRSRFAESVEQFTETEFAQRKKEDRCGW